MRYSCRGARKCLCKTALMILLSLLCVVIPAGCSIEELDRMIDAGNKLQQKKGQW